MTETAIWAHRGASHKYIENTIPAFKQAIADQADGVELDVQRTKDGKLVVFHDENLKRLTGLDQFLWQITWEELRDLDLHSLNGEANVPLLKEVLALMKETDLRVNIELKNSLCFYPGMEAEVLALVQEMDMIDQVLFSSFNHESMHLMSKLAGPETCALLTSDIHHEPWQYAQKVGVKAIHPMVNSLQQTNYVEECHCHGLKVNVWTADEEAYINAALLSGVDAIMTNKPEKAVQLRKQFQADNGKEAMEMIQALGFHIPKEG